MLRTFNHLIRTKGCSPFSEEYFFSARREATGKGGRHRIFFPVLDEVGYRKNLLGTVIDSMMRDYPVETRKVLKEY